MQCSELLCLCSLYSLPVMSPSPLECKVVLGKHLVPLACLLALWPRLTNRGE